jgi:hypothetical protein
MLLNLKDRGVFKKQSLPPSKKMFEKNVRKKCSKKMFEKNVSQIFFRQGCQMVCLRTKNPNLGTF